MILSTPARRVTGDMGQPSQAPKSRIVTTPSAIPTSSMSPPSSRTAGRIFSRARRTSFSTMLHPNSPRPVPGTPPGADVGPGAPQGAHKAPTLIRDRSAFVDEDGGDLPGDANELVGSVDVADDDRQVPPHLELALHHAPDGLQLAADQLLPAGVGRPDDELRPATRLVRHVRA